MKKHATTRVLTATALALLLGGATACASENRASDGREGSVADRTSALASDEVVDVRWSEIITTDQFENRWKVAYEDAIYDASRTKYTTPAEFKDAHNGENYESWYSRVTKKDYGSYMQEKSNVVRASPNASPRER